MDQAETAINELIMMLGDKDQVVVHSAASMVLKLSQLIGHVVPLRNAIYNSSLVDTLIKVLASNADMEISRVAVEGIHNFSNDKQGLSVIFKAGGIKVLVGLLRCVDKNI